MPENAKTAGANGGHQGFIVSNWKPFEKNTLKAFLSLTLPSGLTVNDCTLHERDGARWIGVPAKQYEKAGEVLYKPIIEFDSKETRERFQSAALGAVDVILKDGSECQLR